MVPTSPRNHSSQCLTMPAAQPRHWGFSRARWASCRACSSGLGSTAGIGSRGGEGPCPLPPPPPPPPLPAPRPGRPWHRPHPPAPAAQPQHMLLAPRMRGLHVPAVLAVETVGNFRFCPCAQPPHVRFWRSACIGGTGTSLDGVSHLQGGRRWWVSHASMAAMCV